MGFETNFNRSMEAWQAISEGCRIKSTEIFERRQKGQTFPYIADQMGYSVAYVYKLYRMTLDRMPAEGAAELRAGENAKLDALEEECLALRDAYAPLVQRGAVVHDYVRDAQGNILYDENGDPRTVVLKDFGTWMHTISKRLQIMERRARLNGFDMPTKVALTDPTGEKSVVAIYLPDNGRSKNGIKYVEPPVDVESRPVSDTPTEGQADA